MDLKRPTIRFWEPWFYKDINAGEIESMPGLTLITVRAAGAYIFDDQPEIGWRGRTLIIHHSHLEFPLINSSKIIRALSKGKGILCWSQNKVNKRLDGI